MYRGNARSKPKASYKGIQFRLSEGIYTFTQADQPNRFRQRNSKLQRPAPQCWGCGWTFLPSVVSIYTYH